MYQHLTSPHAHSTPTMTHASTNFTAIPAGPGIAKPQRSSDESVLGEDSGVTSFRVPSKDRTFTDDTVYKGVRYALGDYVHLMNPDEAGTPIVGQIFRTWIPKGG